MGDSMTDISMNFPSGTAVQAKNEAPILTHPRGDRSLHWSDLLARELKCEMVNTGVGGYQTTQLLSKMQEMIFQYNPSHVLLNIGSNDLAPWNNKDYKQTMDNIRSIVSQIVGKGIVCYLWTCSCNFPQSYSQEKISILDKYEKELNDVAKQYGCQHVSIWDYAWGKVPARLKNADALHNTGEGNFLIAKKLYDFITSLDAR